jgi:hypothetical protein
MAQEPDRAEAREAGGQPMHAVLVACVALVALVGVVAISVLALPDDQKGQNIIAIASASFGVIGAIVGAYFGVSSANRAAEIVREAPVRPERRERLERPPGPASSGS